MREPPLHTDRMLTRARSCLNQARADFGGSRPVQGAAWDSAALVCSGAGAPQSRPLHPNRPSEAADQTDTAVVKF